MAARAGPDGAVHHQHRLGHPGCAGDRSAAVKSDGDSVAARTRSWRTRQMPGAGRATPELRGPSLAGGGPVSRWTRPSSADMIGTMNVEAINVGLRRDCAGPRPPSPSPARGSRATATLTRGAPRPGQALTLIEAEALESIGLTGAESLRQVVVRGVTERSGR